MKRLLKSWVFWVFVAPAVLAGLGFFILQEDVHSLCRCGSWRTETHVGVGWPEKGMLRLTPGLFPTEKPSQLFSDLLAGTHAHRWFGRYHQTNSLWIRGRTLCLSADGPSDLAVDDEEFPAFHDWLRARVKAGEISATAVDAELDKPRRPSGFAFGWSP